MMHAILSPLTIASVCDHPLLLLKGCEVCKTLTNDKLTLLFNKSYVQNCEGSLSNKDFFRALITKLKDDNRIVAPTDSTGNQIEESGFVEILNDILLDKVFVAVAMTRAEVKGINANKNLVIMNEIQFPNFSWIGIELLSKGIIRLYYGNFIDQNQFKEFLRNLTKLCITNRVEVYSRDVNFEFIEFLKRMDINYYTLLRNDVLEQDRREFQKELRQKTNGRCKLKYTTRANLIHERKILFDDVIITADNAFENLIVSDPTWEITVEVDKSKFEEWRKKNNRFNSI